MTAPDRQTLDEILRCLSIHRGNEAQRELASAIAASNLDDPLARKSHLVSGVEVEIWGNSITRKGTHSSGPVCNLLADGKLAIGPVDEEGWITSFREAGWHALKGNSNHLRSMDRRSKVVALTTVTRSGSPFWHLNMTFRIGCPHEGARNMLVMTRSSPSKAGALSVIAAIESYREAIPVDGEEEERRSTALIRQEFDRLATVHGADLEMGLQRTGPGSYVAEMTVLDAMLTPRTETITILIGSSLTSHLFVNEGSLNDLNSKIAQHARRSAKLDRGIVIGSIARQVLGERNPRHARRWRARHAAGLTQKSRITINDGSIGAEIIVERDKQRLFRIQNASFEIPGLSLPSSAAMEYVGKPLRAMIEHPMITDQMVITSIKAGKGRTTGRYRDGGITSYRKN